MKLVVTNIFLGQNGNVHKTIKLGRSQTIRFKRGDCTCHMLIFLFHSNLFATEKNPSNFSNKKVTKNEFPNLICRTTNAGKSEREYQCKTTDRFVHSLSNKAKKAKQVKQHCKKSSCFLLLPEKT